MNLCEDVKYDEAFFFQDFLLDDKVYRIFNYRLVGWTTFQDSPDAKKCRGTMFEISGETPILVCLPPDKFFNYAEGGVNHSNITGQVYIHEKLDGSLISTYLHNDELRLKSKGSIKSQQAIEAMEWLELSENKDFKDMLWVVTNKNSTINLEWIGPQNRIVVGYEKPELKVLNVIHNKTGFMDINIISKCFEHHAKELYIHDFIKNQNDRNINNLVNIMYNETSGEGYVLSFYPEDGEFYQVKVKNHTYCNLHKIKDSISNPESLAELIIRGNVDDVYELFSDDMITINLIEDMENKIVPLFNHMVATVEAFYFENKHLIRKDYAIKAKAEVESLMPLLMNLYIEREISYEDFAVRNLNKMFGVKNVNKTI